MLLAVDSERVRDLLGTLPRAKARRVLRSIRDLAGGLGGIRAHAVLCDPNGVPETILEPMIAHAASCGTPFFIASAPTTRAAELVLRWADSGLAGALFCNCNPDVRSMTRQLSADVAECTLGLRLLAKVRHRILRLPRNCRAALVGAITARCHSSLPVDALANRASASRRSVGRWLSEAGLAPPHTLLAVFRLAHALPELSQSRQSVPIVANREGYSSDRILRAHCERVLGCSPSEIRRFRSDADVLTKLTEAISVEPVADATRRFRNEILSVPAASRRQVGMQVCTARHHSGVPVLKSPCEADGDQRARRPEPTEEA